MLRYGLPAQAVASVDQAHAQLEQSLIVSLRKLIDQGETDRIAQRSEDCIHVARLATFWLPINAQDLSKLSVSVTGPIGLVTIGNALHWMDEPSTLSTATSLPCPGGAIAIVTQGPPLWLGSALWQAKVREALERLYGPVSGNYNACPRGRLDAGNQRWSLAATSSIAGESM